MIVPDFINGSLEFIGGLFWWSNVKRLLKDKTIQGVNWSTQAFFTGWEYGTYIIILLFINGHLLQVEYF